jgi:ABC-type transport system substrate-binding protein
LRNKTFRAIGATAVLLGVLITALAQTGSAEPESIEVTAPAESTSEQIADPIPSTTTAPEPFEYRIGLLAGVSTVNFWQYVGEEPTVWNAYVLGPTKPALYGIDPDDNGLVGDLAEGGPVQPTWDETGWRARVSLASDLSWSDGTPVTADDVVYTFETVRRLGLGGGWAEAYPAGIETIVAESPSELRIEFATRPSLRLWPYGLGLAPIMAAHAWAPLTAPLSSADALYALDAGTDLAGGPLQLLEVDGAMIRSAANPGYPGTAPDTVTYLIYPDESAAVTALESGEIDTVISPNGLSAASVGALTGKTGVTIEKSPANSVRYLGFNLGREPMSNPGFRQAVALLVDREAATQTLVPDASAAYTMLTAANRTWYDDDAATAIAGIYTGDLSDRLGKAIAALEGAGYSWATPPSVIGGALGPGSGLTVDGQTPAPLTILTPGDEYDPARPGYTQRIEETLEILGFDVRPVVTDFDTVIDLAFTANGSGARQYDMYVLGWTLGNPALPDYYRWLFASEGPANSTGYSSAQFDSTLRRYEEATNAEVARAALWGMERTLADDLPYLVLYHPEIAEAYRSDRVAFATHAVLGGIQGRLGGIGDLSPAS